MTRLDFVVDVGVAVGQRDRVAEGYPAKKHEDSVSRDVAAAVRCRLGEKVGEVDALSVEVAGLGCLGRRDAHALREDSTEVRETRTMPE